MTDTNKLTSNRFQVTVLEIDSTSIYLFRRKTIETSINQSPIGIPTFNFIFMSGKPDKFIVAFLAASDSSWVIQRDQITIINNFIT